MRRVLFLLLVAGCSLAPAQTLSPEVKQFVTVDAPVIALEHVRVIDGTGAPAREDQTIVLASGRFSHSETRLRPAFRKMRRYLISVARR